MRSVESFHAKPQRKKSLGRNQTPRLYCNLTTLEVDCEISPNLRPMQLFELPITNMISVLPLIGPRGTDVKSINLALPNFVLKGCLWRWSRPWYSILVSRCSSVAIGSSIVFCVQENSMLPEQVWFFYAMYISLVPMCWFHKNGWHTYVPEL